MVENYNKIVHDDDYEDPEMLRKMGYHQSPQRRSPLKSSSKLNRDSSKKAMTAYGQKINDHYRSRSPTTSKKPSAKLSASKSTIDFNKRMPKDRLIPTNNSKK